MVPSSKSIFIAVGVLCCLLIVSAVVLFIDMKAPQEIETEFTSVPVTEEYVETEGTVISIDEEKGLIYASIAPSGERKEIRVWSETKIVRMVIYNSTTSAPTATTQEYNISDIPVGSQIQIRYGAEQDNVLTYVDQIYLGEISFEDFERGEKPVQLFSSTIISFDAQTKTLTYKGRSFITNADFEQSMVLSPEIPVYTVDAVRAGIHHARVAADISALGAGKSVYLLYKPTQENEEAELESIIVAN